MTRRARTRVPRSPARIVCPRLLPVVLAACGGTAWDLDPKLGRAALPEVPADAVLDYAPVAATAHAALPMFDAERAAFTGPGRIWLKGSAACREARVGTAGQPVALDPPYYTAVVEAPAGTTAVEFAGAPANARTVQVTVPDAAVLNTPGAPFRALFFGDFQPFVIQKGRVHVNAGVVIGERDRGKGAEPPSTTLVAVRRMFQLAAEGALPSFGKPAFACGVGDQVYVEGDYHAWDEYGDSHPMSAWTVEAQPRPRVALADLPRFLDVCYRAHWSFTSFERALQACPSLMTWDDHDIRDGWGSQGDEHVWRDSFFRVFREAYIAHQVRRGPRPWDETMAAVDAPLWQSFAVGGVPVFVLDLRTCRDVAVPRVIGDAQWRALRTWFASLDASRCKHYVLVSSVPLFYRVGERATIAAAFKDEVRDDLIDTWTSKWNEPEWREIVGEIAAAGGRGLRGLVVSGDYHVNALCRVTSQTGPGPAATIAYELVASGLANDEYGDWKQRMAREGWFDETPIELANTTLETSFSFADPCPSFGGLEFAGDQVTAHVFQASAEGCFHERVPLTWTNADEDLRDLVQRSRLPLDPALLR